MNLWKDTLPRAAAVFCFFTLLCGLCYTVAVTFAAQLFFPDQANGSLIEVNGQKYGSSLIGQPFEENGHLWGRIMYGDVTTYQKQDGTPLYYASPSNLSPASEAYEELVRERIDKIRLANPAMLDTPIPVDLVTCSGSGLDPHISPSAAAYQTARLAAETGRTEEEITSIIKSCTKGRWMGLFGEKTVNVLEVNLKLDGLLE